jgi:hypothetical protein
MKRTTKQKQLKKQKQKNKHILYFSLLLSLLGIGILIGFQRNSVESFLSRAQNTEQQLNCPSPAVQAGIQMVPCSAITPIVPPAPPPLVNAPGAVALAPGGNICAPDGPTTPGCQCPPYQEEMPGQAQQTPSQTVATVGGQNRSNGSGSGSGSSETQCNSKPIIYLYPTKTTLVSVLLDIPGTVTVSDPLYPASGWKNIEAHPDGTFMYNQKSYQELYYESATIRANPPTEGIITTMGDLRVTLLDLTTKLGLNAFEQKEFMDYWMPELESLHSPYLFVSVFDKAEKEKVDHVVISPQPDTKIEFLAYFKAVDAPFPVAPLQVKPAPKRTGFTTVEWGGTIENR